MKSYYPIAGRPPGGCDPERPATHPEFSKRAHLASSSRSHPREMQRRFVFTANREFDIERTIEESAPLLHPSRPSPAYHSARPWLGTTLCRRSGGTSFSTST